MRTRAKRLPQREHEVLRQCIREVDKISVFRCRGLVAVLVRAGERQAAGEQLAHDRVVDDERQERGEMLRGALKALINNVDFELFQR